jgi:hypothetical protein
VRVVTRENGRYFDLMPSPLSSYLLPTLADCSLVRREARSAGGALRFTGNAVEVDEIRDVVGLGGLHSLFSGVKLSTSLFGLAIGGSSASSLQGLGRLGLGASITDAVMGIATASPTTIVPSEAAAAGTVVLPDRLPSAVEASDEAAAVEPLAPDAPVAEVASRVAMLSELSDERLADLFQVERETFCRWRTGVLTNPRVGNRRRLGLLLALLEELTGRQVKIKDWLLNSVTPQGLTPYQLLERGRIDEVAFLAASIGQPAVDRDARIAAQEEPEPLEFGDDDVWELEPLDGDER